MKIQKMQKGLKHLLKNSGLFNIYLSLILLTLLSCKHNSSKKATAVFHYNQVNYINSLDPAFAKTQNNIWAVDHLFNQLVDLNDSMKLKPELAKTWTVSSDGLQYLFVIRKDAFFIDDSCFKTRIDRHVTAFDVAFSFNRLMDPKLSSPGSWIFKDKIDSIEGIKALNDSVLSIKLKAPFAPFLKLLSMQYCSVIPPEAQSYYGKDLYKNPVGTGAFRLVKWLDRKGIFMAANPDYFDKKSFHLNGIRISFMEDRNTAYLEFLKNEIDFFSGLQSGYAFQLVDKTGTLREDKKNKLQLLKGDFLNTEYIGFNFELIHKNHPLFDKRIRQALNYAIDRNSMIQLLKFGIGTPASAGFIPKGLPSFDPSKVIGYDYNPDKAKRLLSEAGYSNKKGFPELIIHTNKDYVDLITYVAKQWEEIGIPVRIELAETATLREKMRLSEYQIFRASWIADYPDEESFLTVFYSKNPAPPNYTRFKNEAFDALYETAIKETNELKRIQYYQQMDQILIDEAPVIFLFYDQTAWFTQNHILNIKPNPINLLKLDGVTELD